MMTTMFSKIGSNDLAITKEIYSRVIKTQLKQSIPIQ